MKKNAIHAANRLCTRNVGAKVATVGSWRVSIGFINVTVFLFSQNLGY
jgi:hypothetical protein